MCHWNLVCPSRIRERPCSLSSYSSPLTDVARAHDVKCQLYAEDDQLWISFRPADRTHALTNGSQIQSCLHDIDDWMVHSKLKNNLDKLLVLLVGTHQQLNKIDFDKVTLSNIEVKISPEIRG